MRGQDIIESLHARFLQQRAGIFTRYIENLARLGQPCPKESGIGMEHRWQDFMPFDDLGQAFPHALRIKPTYDETKGGDVINGTPVFDLVQKP